MLEYEEEARRTQILLRALLMGPTGAGKSLAALMLANAIYAGEIPFTLINTERGRARLYADRFKYALIDMSEGNDFSPQSFINAIDLAETRNPGGTIILDSSSHEWMGKNGVLQQADRFGDWKTVRPLHTAFVDRLLAVNGHVIVTCRAKMKYLVGEETVPGREKPRQTVSMLGVGPIQDGEFQYEFNLVGQLEQSTHECMFSGHVDPLVDTISNFHDDIAEVAEKLTKWLSEGDAPEPPQIAEPDLIENLRGLLTEEGISEDRIESGFAAARLQNRGELHPDYVSEQSAKSQQRLAAAKAKADAAKPAEEPPAEAVVESGGEVS